MPAPTTSWIQRAGTRIRRLSEGGRRKHREREQPPTKDKKDTTHPQGGPFHRPMRLNPSRRLLLSRCRCRRRTWIRRDEARATDGYYLLATRIREKKKEEKRRGEESKENRHPVSAGWLAGVAGWMDERTAPPKTLVCGWLTYHVPQYGSRRSLVPNGCRGRSVCGFFGFAFFFPGTRPSTDRDETKTKKMTKTTTTTTTTMMMRDEQ
ncbi:hypothetical protein IWX50DRAFT_643041 [Phyllosticta citricarpa]|uniref:Uncharacterized protein n=1 Tax=Phyllosticta citricarpa TaxID=55181 RepID=A0ABR1LVI0_9PEZI